MSSDIVERLNACRNGLFWPEARDAIDRIEALEKDRAEWKALAAEFQELTRGWEAQSEALQAELAKAREAALEEAAQLIDANIIKDTSAGKTLAPRQDGNRDGQHYAVAIRALQQKEREA